MQSRRTFLKNTCAACIGMSALGIFLDACSTSQHVVKSSVENNTCAIPMEKFQTTRTVILRNKQLPFDILVVHEKDQFFALQMRCTHNDVALSFSGNKLICTAHGSEFDMQGHVVKEPAALPLTNYRTEVKENQLLIYLH